MADYGYTRRGHPAPDRLAATCVKVYVDDRTSPDMKPQLMSCLAEMGPGDRLVVSDFTEISRSVGTAKEVMEWLQTHGQEFSVLGDPKFTVTAVLEWLNSLP